MEFIKVSDKEMHCNRRDKKGEEHVDTSLYDS